MRGFQLAWPPLAYSIRDDDEARRAYAVIVTWFVAVCTFVGTTLFFPAVLALLERWKERRGPLAAAIAGPSNLEALPISAPDERPAEPEAKSGTE